MHIDGRALARAAHQLDTALRHVDDAQRIDAPLVLGRGRARESVDAAFGNARDWAVSASSELEKAGAAATDARIAVDRLAADIDAIRFGRDVLAARKGEAFRATVEGARTWALGLGTLRAGAEALEHGSAHAWLVRHLDSSAGRDHLLAARALSRDARIDGLGEATAGFLRRLEPDDERSLELARLALERGGATASAALLDNLVQAADAGVDLDVLRRALQGLDDGVGNGTRRLPSWLDEHTSGTRALDDIEVQELELLRRLDDPATLAEQARELVARPVTDLGHDQITRIAAMAELPAHARPALPGSSVDGVSLAQALRTGADPEPHIHRMWVAGITTDTATNAAATQLLESGDNTSETARRLGALAAEHPTVLGRRGDDAWRSTMADALRATHDEATAVVLKDAIRTNRARSSAEALETEATALLDEHLDSAAVRRLAALASLPEGARPAALDGMRESLLDGARVGATGSVDDVRWVAERESLVAGPNAASRAWEALDEVVAKPDEQIELSDLIRLRRLLDLPDGVRPDVPNEVRNYTLDDIIDAGWLPRNDSDSRAFVQEIRRRLDAERRRVEVARLASDPSVTPASLKAQVYRIVAKPDAEVTLDDLRRLVLMDELPSKLDAGLPAKATGYSRRQLLENEWLPGADGDARREFASLRTWSERERLLDDPRVTRESLTEELDSMLAKADDDITIDDLRRLAVYDELPRQLRPELPNNASSYTRRELHANSWLPSGDSDARAEFASLRMFRAAARIADDPNVTRQSTTAEALAIIDKPHDQITRDDVLRLALFESLPAHRRPDIPPTVRHSMRELHRAGWLPNTDADARAEFEALHSWRQVQRLNVDAAVTRRSLTAQIEAILAKPDDQVTLDDLRRLTLVEHATLDKAKRVALPERGSAYTRAQLLEHRWLPGNDSDARAEFASLRRWMERSKLIDDPAVTRETLTEEIARIAMKADADVTREDVARIALLEGLPATHRPQLPRQASPWGRDVIASHGWLPSNDSDARAEFASLRRWAAETETGRAAVRERVAAGEHLDPLILDSLVRKGETALRSVGLTPEDVLGQSLRALRAASPTDLVAIEAGLKLSKQLLADVSGTLEMRRLATGATRLMELNIRRLAGNVGDGYGRYPDYAEVGRAIEQAELVLALRAATHQPRAVHGTAPAVVAGPAPEPAAGGESLTW